MIHLSLASPSFFSSNSPLSLVPAHQPLTLSTLAQASRSSRRQTALLEFFCDHLPSSNRDLLVNRANPATVHSDIGSIAERFTASQNFSQSVRFGLLHCKSEQLLDVCGCTEFCVGDQSSGKLVQTFAKLQSQWLVAARE